LFTITINMALSPVVTHTVEATQPQSLGRAISSPLKNVTSQTSSSNGTPMPPVTSAPAPTSIPTTLDLAEQMNDEEKRKYVKGMLQR
jgi:cyclin-dependent kinase 7